MTVDFWLIVVMFFLGLLASFAFFWLRRSVVEGSVLKDSVAAGLERVKYCEDQFVDMKMQFDLLMMTVREGQDKSVGKEQVLPSTVMVELERLSRQISMLVNVRGVGVGGNGSNGGSGSGSNGGSGSGSGGSNGGSGSGGSNGGSGSGSGGSGGSGSGSGSGGSGNSSRKVDVPDTKITKDFVMSRTSYLNPVDHILHLITTDITTSHDIQITLGKSREHTARLLKKMYNDGYLSRKEGVRPYVYELTLKGASRLRRNS